MDTIDKLDIINNNIYSLVSDIFQGQRNKMNNEELSLILVYKLEICNILNKLKLKEINKLCKMFYLEVSGNKNKRLLILKNHYYKTISFLILNHLNI